MYLIEVIIWNNESTYFLLSIFSTIMLYYCAGIGTHSSL